MYQRHHPYPFTRRPGSTRAAEDPVDFHDPFSGTHTALDAIRRDEQRIPSQDATVLSRQSAVMVAAQPVSQELKNGMARLYGNGKFADMTITCGIVTFKAHKAILCSSSGFFEDAFSHEMQETLTGTIDLKDKEAAVVRAMLESVYTLNYATPSDKEWKSLVPLLESVQLQPEPYDLPDAESILSPSHDIIFHVAVYALALQYRLKDLTVLALFKFQQSASKDYDNEIFCSALKAITDWIPEQDKELRGIALNTAIEHFDTLARTCSYSKIYNIAPWFATSVALAMHARLPTVAKQKWLDYLCSDCYKTFTLAYFNEIDRHVCCIACGGSTTTVGSNVKNFGEGFAEYPSFDAYLEGPWPVLDTESD